MNPLQLTRALLALCIVPLSTFIVSVAALVDVRWGRKSSVKALQFPRIWGRFSSRLAGIRVTVEGQENLDPQQTYIFVGNHTSQTDILTFQGYIPHVFRWIAKKELFDIPIFGTAMLAVEFIPIDRSRGRQAVKSLNAAAERIAEGSSVLIFPEGTRSPDGRLHPFKTGAIMLAIKAGVPVVPVGFNGTYQVLPKGSLLSRGGDVVLRIGRPISTKDFQAKDKQELACKLHDEVAALLDPCHKPAEQK
jgi:1-acyl-sn-glycerol-3-phosphate acyltransferase